MVMLRDGDIALQFDSRLHSRIALPAAGHEAALGDFAASEYVVTHDDRTLDDFTLAEQRLEPVRDAVHGPGQRLTLRGELVRSRSPCRSRCTSVIPASRS